jgi:splicing factor 3B subunit 2
MEVETLGSVKLQKLQKQRQKRRDRKKAKKKQQQEQQKKVEEEVTNDPTEVKMEEEEEFEIEYVAAPVFQNEEEASMFEDIKDIVDHFSLNQKEEEQVPEKAEQVQEVKEEKLSKKKRKLQKRLPIAVLKQLVDRPDLVEIHDTSAADPFVLLHMKSTRNTVPIPRHWSQKKKYLQVCTFLNQK